MLGSLILYLKVMRRMMFQLSGFYYKTSGCRNRDDGYSKVFISGRWRYWI